MHGGMSCMRSRCCAGVALSFKVTHFASFEQGLTEEEADNAREEFVSRIMAGDDDMEQLAEHWYVCMYACMHACMYVCTCARTHTETHAYIICIHTHH